MLNSKKERELVYLVNIDNITPIEGADRVELAHVGGWTIMVRKGQFNKDDIAIYFEIDSKVPETEPFAFLADKHYKVKTQKYFKGKVWSQGLLMHPADFGWSVTYHGIKDDKNAYHYVDDETRFLTNQLGVIYSVVEDNARKANPADKYKKMAQRHGKLFSHQPFRWMMKYNWGKKFLFVFFGKKKDSKSQWPSWVAKTDEERAQNIPWILSTEPEWIATEKIDGTSTTFTMHRKGEKKFNFYICSRNVVFDKPDKKCFYETNVYTEMAEKYKVEETLKEILLSDPELEWVTLQGETYGAGIQKRDYSIKDHNFMGFNFITSRDGRWNSKRAEALMLSYGIPWVPIIDEHFVMPETVAELLEIATGSSVVDGKEREGLVFRSTDGTKSFKAVSNSFLMKYHN